MSERITNNDNDRGGDAALAGSGNEAIEQIRRALAGLRYGTVSVVVQDGVVIQIERTERTRLQKTLGVPSVSSITTNKRR